MSSQVGKGGGADSSMQATATNSDRQDQATRASGFNNVLAGMVSLVIFLDAGRGGAAVCAYDLVGWHRINAIVALGGAVLSIFLFALSRWDATGKTFWRGVDSSLSGASGIFLFVWFIIGNTRLWGTVPCVEMTSSLSCCENDLWYATQGWFVFNYVLVGLFLVLCCCCCCCLGPAMMTQTMSEAAAQQQQPLRDAEAGVVRGVPVSEASPLVKGPQGTVM